MQLKRHRWLALQNRGDTIVEVLIVIIILSMVLASAYAVGTRTQKVNQQTQEHTQALKLAEGQLENIKAAPTSVGSATRFCFSATGTPITGSFGTGLTTTAASDQLSQYPAACRQAAEGGDCSSTPCRYYVGVVKNGDLYMVTVRWDGITGKRDEVKLLYRQPS